MADHVDQDRGDQVEGIEGLEDHLCRVVARTERASALIFDMLDANLAQVGIRQNEDMRKISAWAAVFLLPTVLSGIWGMNFATMPETKWVYGYPVALAIMVIGTVMLYRKLRKWLAVAHDPLRISAQASDVWRGISPRWLGRTHCGSPRRPSPRPPPGRHP